MSRWIDRGGRDESRPLPIISSGGRVYQEMEGRGPRIGARREERMMRDVLNPPTTNIDFIDWYGRNRERSAMLFDMVDAQAYTSRPIPLRHPVLFYEGHL